MKDWKDVLIICLLVLGSLAAVYLSPDELKAETTISGKADQMESVEEAVVSETLVYGIPMTGYAIEYSKVRPRQFLSDILHSYGVDMGMIHAISLLPDTLLNVRKIKPGNRYAIFSVTDSIAQPAWFVYEKDDINYVTVRLDTMPVMATNRKKPVTYRLRKASGTIETSLWESMLNAGTNPMMSVELSEIYAWSIDFFGLQQGDQYKVIYEETYVDSVSVGIHQINGAWFRHSGTEFWAIPYFQDSVRSFFDEEGNSLRKAFLKAPLRFSRISSGYSNSRFHPILKIYRPHHGVDYSAPAGTPVHTVGDGVVQKAAWDRGGGYFVRIKHNSVYSTSYLHLSRFAKGIKPGAYVKQGDVIGYVGSTGLSTGPHLDFRFYKNGSAVNPLRVEAPPVEPIAEKNMAAYNILKEITIQSLKAVN